MDKFEAYRAGFIDGWQGKQYLNRFDYEAMDDEGLLATYRIGRADGEKANTDTKINAAAAYQVARNGS